MPSYTTVTTKQQLKQLGEQLDALPDQHIVAIDHETSGLCPQLDTVVGTSISWDVGQATYIPSWCAEQDTIEFTFHDVGHTIRKLKRLRIIAHKWVFDSAFSYTNFGVALPVYDDTYVLARLTCEELDLGVAMQKYFKRPAAECRSYTDLMAHHFGTQWKSKKYTAADLPLHDTDPLAQSEDWGIAYYGCGDADYTRQYYFYLKPKIKTMGLSSLHKIETNLLPIVRKLNLTGVPLNPSTMRTAATQVITDVERMEKEIYALAGEEFKINSPQDAPRIIFTKLKLPIILRSQKTGSPSLKAEVLDQLSGLHPIIDLIRDWRNDGRMHKSYLEKLPNQMDDKGRVYTEFNSIAAVSGRFTSSSMENHNHEDWGTNLQNQSKKRYEWVGENNEQLSASVRQAFEAPPGWTWVRGDYIQIEPRVQANLAQESFMLDNFRRGIDSHTVTASACFRMSIEDVIADTKSGGDKRKKGKIINLALSYGMGLDKLARLIHCSEQEAEHYLDTYWAAVPKLRALVSACQQRLIDTHTIKTFFGRTRFINVTALQKYSRGEYDSALRKAFNTTVQGTGADLLKIGMLRVDSALRPFGKSVELILTVHDELDFLVRNEVLFDALPVIARSMEIPVPDNWVPFSASISHGPNWDETFLTEFKDRDPEPFTGWKNLLPKECVAHDEIGEERLLRGSMLSAEAHQI